ncbi:MAG: hypothetical protein NUV80_00575, partial [Candidatus Berkelbacteria bacterium]|nr:hypothetical protein [Candidatus Berkelbacteria bacterium]
HSVLPAVFGRVFVVFDADDTSSPAYDEMISLMDVDPKGVVRFYTSLESAYAACTTNNNDVILLDARSSHVLANGIAWSKSRINVIGMDGGDRLVQQGAKVQTTDAVGDAYVLKVTGVRNSFRNIKFIQVDTNAAALHVLEEGGEGSLYKNCSFTFGVVDNLDLTTATEVLCGSDSATFKECLFGTETLLTSAARTVFTIDQVTTSQEFKSNILKDCVFMISSSSATAKLISVVANTDVLYTNLWDNCTFMASVDSAGGAAITNAVQSIGSLVKGTLNFKNCASFNCTNFCNTLTANVMTFGPVTSAQAGEGGTPS